MFSEHTHLSMKVIFFLFFFFLLNAFQSHGWLRRIHAAIDGTISFSSEWVLFFFKDTWGEDGIPFSGMKMFMDQSWDQLCQKGAYIPSSGSILQ